MNLASLIENQYTQSSFLDMILDQKNLHLTDSRECVLMLPVSSEFSFNVFFDNEEHYVSFINGTALSGRAYITYKDKVTSELAKFDRALMKYAQTNSLKWIKSSYEYKRFCDFFCCSFLLEHYPGDKVIFNQLTMTSLQLCGKHFDSLLGFLNKKSYRKISFSVTNTCLSLRQKLLKQITFELPMYLVLAYVLFIWFGLSTILRLLFDLIF